MSKTTFSGACLCGKVKYSVMTTLKDFYFCHCEQCRKITGSAFSSNILTKPEKLNWISGYNWVQRFDYPGERIFTKVFCKNCGSGLPYLNETGDSLVIPAGSLNSNVNTTPQKNIFWEDRARWYEAGIEAPTCAKFSK